MQAECKRETRKEGESQRYDVTSTVFLPMMAILVCVFDRLIARAAN